MSYLNKLHEPDSHLSEIRRQPIWGAVYILLFYEKIEGGLCAFSKTYFIDLRTRYSHFNEICTQSFLGSLLFFSKVKYKTRQFVHVFKVISARTTGT